MEFQSNIDEGCKFYRKNSNENLTLNFHNYDITTNEYNFIFQLINEYSSFKIDIFKDYIVIILNNLIKEDKEINTFNTFIKLNDDLDLTKLFSLFTQHQIKYDDGDNCEKLFNLYALVSYIINTYVNSINETLIEENKSNDFLNIVENNIIAKNVEIFNKLNENPINKDELGEIAEIIHNNPSDYLNNFADNKIIKHYTELNTTYNTSKKSNTPVWRGGGISLSSVKSFIDCVALKYFSVIPKYEYLYKFILESKLSPNSKKLKITPETINNQFIPANIFYNSNENAYKGPMDIPNYMKWRYNYLISKKESEKLIKNIQINFGEDVFNKNHLNNLIKKGEFILRTIKSISENKTLMAKNYIINKLYKNLNKESIIHIFLLYQNDLKKMTGAILWSTNDFIAYKNMLKMYYYENVEISILNGGRPNIAAAIGATYKRIERENNASDKKDNNEIYILFKASIDKFINDFIDEINGNDNNYIMFYKKIKNEFKISVNDFNKYNDNIMKGDVVQKLLKDLNNEFENSKNDQTSIIQDVIKKFSFNLSENMIYVGTDKITINSNEVFNNYMHTISSKYNKFYGQIKADMNYKSVYSNTYIFENIPFWCNEKYLQISRNIINLYKTIVVDNEISDMSSTNIESNFENKIEMYKTLYYKSIMNYLEENRYIIKDYAWYELNKDNGNIKFPSPQELQNSSLENIYDVFEQAGGKNKVKKVFVLNKKRNIVIKNKRECVIYNKKLITLNLAKKLELKIKKKV